MKERERERERERVLAPDERTETEQEYRDRRRIAFRINRVIERNINAENSNFVSACVEICEPEVASNEPVALHASEALRY